ncbi:hypothetical protein F4819DRAFT_463745 [Hypoxylon fuscum]|nr:hypothetical protein F4819DRAFT_463745 [Hypoxylon fuscum]
MLSVSHNIYLFQMEPIFQEYFKNVEVYDEQAEQAPAKSEVDTLQAFLSGNLPANQAAQLLARRSAQPSSTLTRKLRMSMLWSFINNTAVALPSTQSLVIDLIQAIRKSKPEGERAGVRNSEDNWSTLGTWLNKWGDSINNYESGYLWPESENGAEAILWPRVAAYSARLVATRDPVIGDSFFILRCCPSIVRALDTDQALQYEQYRPDIIAAAQLFILSPRELLERSQAEDSIEWLAGDHIKGNVLWPGDITQLSVERWKHWKTRWQTIIESETLEGGTKKLASKSLNGMNLADSN